MEEDYKSSNVIYEPDYLLLRPIKDNNGGTLEELNRLKSGNHNYDFGIFSDIFTNSGTKIKWVSLRFDPISKDRNLPSEYHSRDLALKVAIRYLSEKGFRVIPYKEKSLDKFFDDIELSSLDVKS